MILGREDVAAGPCALRTKGSESPADLSLVYRVTIKSRWYLTQ